MTEITQDVDPSDLNNMADITHGIDPHDLNSAIVAIDNLNLEQNQGQTATDLEIHGQHARLVMLHPLTDADMFASCRDPNSRYIRLVTGKRQLSDTETLDLTPLSKSWRQRLMKVTPFPHLTFDLRMPQSNGKNAAPELKWQGTLAANTGIHVDTQQLVNIVITIASQTKMRTKSDLTFDVVYDEREGIKVQTMEILKKQLDNIANHHPRNWEVKPKVVCRKECIICNFRKRSNMPIEEPTGT